MTEFKPGDVVQLKSGGPKMTCTDAPDSTMNGRISCQWFAGSKLEHGWFPPKSLVIVDDADLQSGKKK